MSMADEIFIQNCRDILDNGVWDTDREVRPRWEDGAPAHTIKKFGVVNRYDLSKEFPENYELMGGVTSDCRPHSSTDGFRIFHKE